MKKGQVAIKSKLFQLREWLTIPEAAKHLTNFIGEDATEADMLRLALDGHLNLAVNFTKKPSLVMVALESNEKKTTVFGGGIIATRKLKSHFGNDLTYGNKVYLSSKRVWDLLLVGNGQSIIENRYYSLTGGPNIILEHWHGTFVKRNNGPTMALVEPKRGSKYPIGTDSTNFRCVENLPNDCIIVVRTQALLSMYERLMSEEQSNDKHLNPRAETTYLNIIGALLEVVTGTFKDENFSSETQLREFIAEKFDDLRGVSARTLADKFALAKKALNHELD